MELPWWQLKKVFCNFQLFHPLLTGNMDPVPTIPQF
jgi:hypothetical protein